MGGGTLDRAPYRLPPRQKYTLSRRPVDEKGSKRQTNLGPQWDCFKGNMGEAWWSAYGISERIDAILN